MHRLTLKMLIFLVVYSTIFFLLRTNHVFNTYILMDEDKELGGGPQLFSAVGTIFSIIGGFIIQNRWNRWNNLIEVMRTEVATLEALAMHARFLPLGIGRRLVAAVQEYAGAVVHEAFDRRSGEDKRLERNALTSLHTAIAEPSTPDAAIPAEVQIYGVQLYTALMTQRRHRLHYFGNRIPNVLRTMILGTCILIWVQALLIGVPNIWIDYLFTTGIAALACLIYLVIEDLDNPLQPGYWYLSSHDYQALLDAGRVR